jgi:hypothetical protein
MAMWSVASAGQRSWRRTFVTRGPWARKAESYGVTTSSLRVWTTV